MAKITLPSISSGYATTTQINNAFDAIESEFQNKVLYRNNPTGEPNQMEQDFDLNGYKILNAGDIEINGVNVVTEMQSIYDNYLGITQNVTVSTSAPSGGSDGDIWFTVSV